MATKENQETLRLLVQYVSRAFYEPKFTIVMDQLARNPVLKDDDLAGRMGLQLKELNKIIAVLEKDRLISIHRQNELKEGAQRSVGRQYFYIDYQHFCNVVKWRVAEMRRIIDSGLRNELDSKGYACPQCGKAFSPLEVDKLIDFTMGVFLCDICHAELVDNENVENTKGNQDRMQRFNFQMRFIREGLRKTEDMVLPAFDVVTWIRDNLTDNTDPNADANTGDGLKIAGSTPGQNKDNGIGVVMSMDKDEATRRKERQDEAAARRQQNMMPTWHLKSTISDDLTALGIAENARLAENAAAKTPSSNDDILRSLGSARAQPQQQPQLIKMEEDVKPVINQSQQEQDFYDQYYASLAASAQQTPVLENGGSEFGEEEEDVKPSIEYLNSLNEYRKRSRSTDDVGTPTSSSSGKKLPRIDSGLPPPASVPEETPMEMDSHQLAHDPIVYVNGEPMKFSEVSEEQTELMTPEEYTAYFDVFQSQQA